MNRILARQLKRAKLSADALPTRVESWQAFLRRVESSYEQDSKDLYLMQRSLELSSAEMQKLYDDLRRLSDSKIAAERDRLEAIISGFPDGFCRLTLDGVVETANPVAQSLFGGDLVGHSVLGRFRLEMSDGNLSEPTAAELRRWMTERDTRRCLDARLLSVGGTEIPVSVLFYPIVQADEVTGCALAFEDIRDQKQAELHRRRLEEAVESSADSVFITDVEGLILYANPAFAKLTGYPVEEAIGKTPRIMRSGETPKAVYEDFWDTILAGQTWSGRIRNARPSSGVSKGKRSARDAGPPEQYWVALSVNPILAEDGSIQGFVAIQRDVSETVEREERQEREREMAHLRAFVGEQLQNPDELAKSITALLNKLLGNVYLPLIESGGVFIRGLDGPGIDVLGLVGKPVRPGRFKPDLSWHAPQLVKHKDSQLIVTPLQAATSTYGWLVAHAEPMDEMPLWLSEFLSDIGRMIVVAIADERARMETEQARVAALNLARSKSEFLANMSHEIRTPMNGVLGMLELLRDTGLNGEQTELLDVAYGSAESLLTVINDILDLSKIEAGKIDIEHIPFDLRTLVEDVTTLFMAPAQAKELEVACFVPVDTKTRLLGDPTRIRQVLSNLIGNAVKFTSRGEVVVRVSQEKLEDGRVETEVRIQDTGIGIDRKQLPNLFQPFNQADSSTTREFGGTGLGLTISRQLVELMGGEVGVESEPGIGSEFWFRIPHDVTGSEDKQVDDHHLHGRHVLLVDDNQTNLSIMSHFLNSWGMRYKTAKSGQQALAMLRSYQTSNHPFEIVVSDYQMPAMDGVQLTEKIRAINEFTNLQVMIISSGNLQQEEWKRHGVNLVSSKPVRQSSLHDALVELSTSLAPVEQPATPAKTGSTSQSEVKQRAGAPQTVPLSGEILLVEDNLTNQKVAVHMLERVGLNVHVAANGVEAVEALRDRSFDAVLMDCQMPVMDGFEATRQIRLDAEESAGKGELRRIPILAMTANAMEGDREACIAAGMDDYIAKPVRRDDLIGKLADWLARDQRGAPAAQPEDAAKTAATDVVLDEAVLTELQALMGDGMKALLEEFIDLQRQATSAMKDAISAGDMEAIRAGLHSLKSSSGQIGALSLSQLADRLEAQESYTPKDLQALFAALKKVSAALKQYLASI